MIELIETELALEMLYIYDINGDPVSLLSTDEVKFTTKRSKGWTCIYFKVFRRKSQHDLHVH